MKKFIIGKTYQSCLDGLVVRCLKDSSNNRFTGVVISKYGSRYYPGHISSAWNKEWFEEFNYKVDTSEGNNGWIKIESEKDLPTEDIEEGYIVGKMSYHGNFTEIGNRMSDRGVIYNYKHNNITHYKKYISLPPNF